MYKLLRALLFLFDPEKVHYFSMNMLKAICSVPFLKTMVERTFTPSIKTQSLKSGSILSSTFNNIQPLSTTFNIIQHHSTLLNKLVFKNPIGLGAGFDKNARYLNELECLGFGFVEIGTVTPKPQEGNDKPRLFRLPQDKALINRMGFNNDGVETVALRLKVWKESNSKIKNQKSKTSPADASALKIIIGGNIGKNKNTPNEEAWKDYEICFKALHPYVDYFVVNVSSPNTPGLRELQEKESLRKIFSVLQSHNNLQKEPKPLLLKIAPDLTKEQVDDVIDLTLEMKLDGLIVSNTSIDKSNLQTDKNSIEKIGAGGLSGKPIKAKSTALIQYIHTTSKGKIFIIGSGGIFTGEDAKEKTDAGASLVQVWTGFIYEGPAIVKKISKYLAASEQ